MRTTSHLSPWAALGSLMIAARAENRESRSKPNDRHKQGGALVKSVNGCPGQVTLSARPGITITPAGNGVRLGAQPSGVLTCAIGTLAGGASATIHLVVVPSAPGWLTNTATVSGNEFELNSTNNLAAAVIEGVVP